MSEVENQSGASGAEPPPLPGAGEATAAPRHVLPVDVAEALPGAVPSAPALATWPPPGYGMPAGYVMAPAPRGRPGLITAVGIISVIVAALGIVTTGLGGCYGLMLYRFAGAPRGRVVSTSVASSSVTSSSGTMVTTFGAGAGGGAGNKKAGASAPAAQPAVRSEYVAPRGMSSRERQAVIRGLAARRVLNDARRRQIHALLADRGRDVFKLAGGALTAEAVRANVSDAGYLPGGVNGTGLDYFVLGQGRLEVGDDRATFWPNGGGETIRVANGALADPEAQGALTAGQVQAVVDRVQSMAGGPLNQAQIDAVAESLQTAGQKLVKPSGSNAGVVGQVSAAARNADGSVSVMFGVTALTFAADGTTLPGWGASTAATGAAVPKLGGGGLALVVLDPLVSLALAGFLLTAGVFVLRQQPVGRRLHVAYALLKIPAALLSGFAVYLLWGRVVAGFNASTPGASASDGDTGVLVAAIVVGVVGCIYPVILLLVMRMRSVRQYFDATVVG